MTHIAVIGLLEATCDPDGFGAVYPLQCGVEVVMNRP